MDRRRFLQSIGILGIGTMLNPKLAIDQLDIGKQEHKPYELAGVSDDCKNQWTNHMTIQRKVFNITGRPVYEKWEREA